MAAVHLPICRVRFWPEADDRELTAHESVRHCARVGQL